MSEDEELRQTKLSRKHISSLHESVKYKPSENHLAAYNPRWKLGTSFRARTDGSAVIY